MRVTPLIGDKLWFGPRDGGWGWQPESWEGWVATWFIAVVYVVGGGLSAVRHGAGLVVLGVATVLLVGVVIAKGTAPGGEAARREFDALRDVESSHRLDVRRLP
jgi:hypothetical protein